MSWIIGAALVLFVLYIVYRQFNTLSEKELYRQISSNWAKPKDPSEFNFYRLKDYFYNEAHYNPKAYFQIIDNSTGGDLDLDEVFQWIDRTNSKIGQQYLYKQLRCIDNDPGLLKKFDERVEFFANNRNIRELCQYHLKTLNEEEAYYLQHLLFHNPPKKPDWYFLVPFLSLLALLFLILTIFKGIFLLALIPILVTNVILHYSNKNKLINYIYAVPQLLKVRKTGKTLSAIHEINDYFKGYSFRAGMERIASKLGFLSVSEGQGNELIAVGWYFMEILKMTFNLEMIFFYRFLNDLSEYQNSLEDAFKFIAHIDSAIAVASYRASLNTSCKPEFHNSKDFYFEEVVHPLIPDCMPNSINLSNKSLLLTGSNMSGKTTFIRSVGLNALLAQTLYTCQAKEWQSPFFKIYSSIRISDDIIEEESYYLKEVNRLEKFVNASHQGNYCLFILDEIFKGTNTAERVAAGKAVLSYLSQGENLVFVATHDIELTEMLGDRYELYHFSERLINGELHFDHKLKKGAIQTSNAIEILSIQNYLEIIIEDARSTFEKLIWKNK